jgi:norsolorinic acid ketoreductase
VSDLQPGTSSSLVTGASRGLGLAFVEELAARPDTIVFAGIRTFPLIADAPLARLAAEHPDVVYPIQISSANEVDNATAANFIKEKAGRVDVIIANAGEHCLPSTLGGSDIDN